MQSIILFIMYWELLFRLIKHIYSFLRVKFEFMFILFLYMDYISI